MKVEKSNPSKTILTIVVGFLIIYLLTKLNWALYVSIVIGAIGVVSKFFSEKIEWLWMKLALILSFIVPNIILSTVFFLLLFPIGLLYRLFRKKDPFNVKNQNESMFSNVQKKFDEESFERMF